MALKVKEGTIRNCIAMGCNSPVADSEFCLAHQHLDPHPKVRQDVRSYQVVYSSTGAAIGTAFANRQTGELKLKLESIPLDGICIIRDVIGTNKK